jgi:putative serine/threonine protein kinase
LQAPLYDSIANSPIRVSALRKTIHGSILCYPGKDLSSFFDRLAEVRELGVQSLIFEGPSKIGRFGVVGKGCVSIVVKARLRSNAETFALKIRRIDANRNSMTKDYQLQKFANSFGVGPKAAGATENFFLMEYVDSLKVGKWFGSLRTRTPKTFVRALIRNCLNQCFLLDKNHIDHGELSNPSKHILIRQNGSKLMSETVIIDYESASLERRPSNLTATAQFFFFGNYQSQKVKKILGITETNEKMISLLREYKEKPSFDSFENLLNFVGC